jgi:hypothetical protein
MTTKTMTTTMTTTTRAMVWDLDRESTLPPVLLPLLTGASAASPSSAGGASNASSIPAAARADLCNKEEELKLEAAMWSMNRKNSYPLKLAKCAKMEYAARAGAVDSGDGGGFARSASGSQSGVMAELSLPMLLPTTAERQHLTATAMTMEESVQWDGGGGGSSSYNADYNSFGPT